MKDIFSREEFAAEFGSAGHEPDTVVEVRHRSHSKSNFRKGVRKDGITKSHFTDAEKIAMCTMKAQGLTHAEIAEKLHRTEQTIRNKFMQISRELEALQLNFDWRKVLMTEAVNAVRAGLNSERDEYKRAAIGVQALKGIGAFEQDNQVNLTNLVAQVPESMRSRYLTTPLPESHLITTPLEESHAVSTQERKDD